MLLLLSGCGGGGGGGDASNRAGIAPDAGSGTPSVSAADAIFVIPTPAGFSPQARADQDGDGLPDDIDPAPGVSALLDESAQALELRNVGVRVSGQFVADTVHADLPLEMEIFGPAAQGADIHLVLVGGDDIRVVQARPAADGFILPPDEVGRFAGSVYATTAQWRTPELPVRYYGEGQPFLAGIEPAPPNRKVRAHGVNLDRGRFSLDGVDIEAEQKAANIASLSLPVTAVSSQLILISDSQPEQSVFLPVLRNVAMNVGQELGGYFPVVESADNSGLKTHRAGEWFDVPADTAAPALIRLGVPAGAYRPPVPLAIVAWPDRKKFLLDVNTLVESLIWKSRYGWGLAATDWRILRDAIEIALRSDAGLVATESLRGLLDESIDDEPAAIAEMMIGLRAEVVRAAQPGIDFSQAVAEPGISQGEALGQNVQYFDSRGNFGPNGSFALFSVGSVFDLCAGLADRPNTFRPADLCMVSSNELASSVAVRRTQSGPFLRRHINPNRGIFNADIVGGTGGFLNLDFFGPAGLVAFKRPFQYLEASNSSKDPLCGVEPCWVEVLTGGFGVGLTTPLTPSEKRVSDLLRRRALVDLIIMPVLGAVSGNLINNDSASCIAGVAFAAFDATAVSADFYQKASATVSTRTGSDGKPETVVDYDALAKEIKKFFQGRLIGLLTASNGIVGCFDKSIINNIDERLADAAEDLGGRFTAVVGLAIQSSISAVQFATTPPKIVFRARPQLSVKSLNAGYDLNQPDASFNNLTIEGTAIAEDQGNNAFLPDLLLGGTTASGFEVTPFTLTQDNYRGGVAADNRFITVEQNLLRQFLFTNRPDDAEQSFDPNYLPGEISVALRYSLPPSSGFTNLDVDVEVGEFDLLGPSRVDGYLTNTVTENDFASVIGYRLENIDLNGAVVILTGPGNSVEMIEDLELFVNRENQRFRRGEIEFQVPELPSDRGTASYAGELRTRLGEVFALPPLFVNSRSAIGVATVTDDGACQDDRAEVVLISDSGGPVSVGEDVPEVVAQVSGPGEEFANLIWDNSKLPAGNRVSRIEVSCVDAGDDCRDAADSGAESAGVCTLGLNFDEDFAAPGEQVMHLSLEEGRSQRFP